MHTKIDPQEAVRIRKVEDVDMIARAICSEKCEARGVEPCWSPTCDRSDALEWPNPYCTDPNCHALAKRVYMEIVGDLIDD